MLQVTGLPKAFAFVQATFLHLGQAQNSVGEEALEQKLDMECQLVTYSTSLAVQFGDYSLLIAKSSKLLLKLKSPRTFKGLTLAEANAAAARRIGVTG